MALGISKTNIVVRGSALSGIRPKIITFTFDGSMPGGGYELTKTDLGFDNGILVGPSGISVARDACAWDAANSKLVAGTAANGDKLTCVVWGY
jgi:hypothetical protein